VRWPILLAGWERLPMAPARLGAPGNSRCCAGKAISPSGCVTPCGEGATGPSEIRLDLGN